MLMIDLRQTLANLSGRSMRILQAIVAGFLGKGVGLVVGVVTIPLAVNYLGAEGYGLYATITSVLAWLQITNLGIGSGLQNALTEAVALNDRERQVRLVSSAMFSLGGIVLGAGIIFTIVFPWINWGRIFPVNSPELVRILPSAVILIFLNLLLTTLLSFIGPIYAAFQRLDRYYGWNATAQAISLLSLLAAIKLDTGLNGVIIGLNGIVNLVLVVNAAWVLSRSRLLPQWRYIDRWALRRIFGSGLAFFVIQVSMIFIFQIDRLLIAQYIGTEQVASYSVGYKIFSSLSMIVSLAITPLWPAYGEAKTIGDFGWIRKTHRRVSFISFGIYIPTAALVVIIGPRILALFMRTEGIPSTILLFFLFAYFIIKTWGDIYAILINGLDQIAPQAISAVVQAVVTTYAMIVLARSIGIIGIPLGGILGYICSSAWFLPYLANRYFNRHPGIPKMEAGNG